MTTDRKHQADARLVASLITENKYPYNVLMPVTPGGGKSRIPGIFLQHHRNLKLAWFVPRLSLARQAALGMKKDFGIDIRESGNDINPSRNTRGFVATHSSLMANPELWQHELNKSPYLLVIDELHHAKIFNDGKRNPLTRSIEKLEYKIRVCMTGTLETNDNSFIYNVPYRETSKGYEPDIKSFDGSVIEYDRPTALGEGAIVPVEFHYHDGPISWQERDGVKDALLSGVESENESQAIWTALRTDLADQILSSCVDHCKYSGTSGKLLVVTADQSSARRYYKDLQRRGISTGLAITDSNDPYGDIDQFRSGRFDCLVTCQMAYEGLDVPSITHLACLTHIRSTPWITQMLARAWRATPTKNRCFAFVPNDPRMNRVIERIRSEQQGVVRFSTDRQIGSGPASRSDETGFVPISGELTSVSAQMLDGQIESSPFELQFREVCQNAGIASDHPLAAQFVDLLRNNPPRSFNDKTITQQEMEIRKEIHKSCSRADFVKERSAGTHQKLLHKELNFKKIEDLSLEGLKYARQICARICT